MDDSEIEAYWDFMRWFLGQEHVLLLSIPKPEEPDFWSVQLDESGNNISQMNTVDFKRSYPFNKYHYKIKKVMEKVKDLALTHSCISDEAAKKRIKDRFLELARRECQDKMKDLFQVWREYAYWE